MSSRGHFSEGVPFAGDTLIAVGANKVPTVGHFTLQSELVEVGLVTQDLIDWGPAYVFPNDAGEAMTIDSTLGDTVPIAILGLDVNFKPQTEIVVLNGVTSVNLAKVFTRINTMLTAGTVETTGVVSVRGSGNIYCQMQPELQISSMGVYTTPAGSTSQILALSASMVKVGGNSDAGLSASLYFRPPNSVMRKAVSWSLQRRGSTTIGIDNKLPLAVPGPIDHVVRVEASATGISIGVRIPFLLQDL